MIKKMEQAKFEKSQFWKTFKTKSIGQVKKEYVVVGGINMELTEKHIEDFFKTLIEIFETRYEVKIKYKLEKK